MEYIVKLFPFIKNTPFIAVIVYLLSLKFVFLIYNEISNFINKKIKEKIKYISSSKNKEKEKNFSNNNHSKNKNSYSYNESKIKVRKDKYTHIVIFYGIKPDTKKDMIKLGIDMRKYDLISKELMDLEYKSDRNSQDKFLNKETDILSDLKKEKDYIDKQYKLKKKNK